mmetsp:Transcript_38820/g.64487  ORF Transcript_38820/g.64487 Transcript_38820/m.64487 type:complete len:206 (-) Transcript_38820:91-708(-)
MYTLGLHLSSYPLPPSVCYVSCLWARWRGSAHCVHRLLAKVVCPIANGDRSISRCGRPKRRWPFSLAFSGLHGGRVPSAGRQSVSSDAPPPLSSRPARRNYATLRGICPWTRGWPAQGGQARHVRQFWNLHSENGQTPRRAGLVHIVQVRKDDGLCQSTHFNTTSRIQPGDRDVHQRPPLLSDTTPTQNPRRDADNKHVGPPPLF